MAACVANSFDLDPFCGAVFVFRSRSRTRLKLLVRDGTGLVLVTKRLDGGRFTWPKPQAAPVTLSRAQFEVLFKGVDWTQVGTRTARKPSFL
ncbi:IS66 family insertion sequence element accessory protein TnpB [Pseudogemmobacter bohemicus]|uniref:IS66 family insertion sequence element accessory protein TnpB n=1 Tax=Pseudogemmobacter bohemicus TaxID=2250708 RepID=UPI000DD38B70